MNQSWEQMPVEPAKRRRVGPAIVGVVALLALVGGIGVVFATRSHQDGTTASVVGAVGSPSGATSNVATSGTDSDHDGLSDADEARYKTNPHNPDTDGDGYKDGDEVANGYNPNGAGKLTTGANVGTAANSTGATTQAPALEQSGTPLATVYSGKGSYTCQITGGTKPNTVTVKVKDAKVRQETPIQGSTAVFIIDGTSFYMNGFKDGKWLKLSFDVSSGVASGPGANVKGGIFASAALVLAAQPTKITCDAANWPDDAFSVPAGSLLTTADQSSTSKPKQ